MARRTGKIGLIDSQFRPLAPVLGFPGSHTTRTGTPDHTPLDSPLDAAFGVFGRPRYRLSARKTDYLVRFLAPWGRKPYGAGRIRRVTGLR